MQPEPTDAASSSEVTKNIPLSALFMQLDALKSDVDERLLKVVPDQDGKCTSEIAREAGVCRNTAWANLWKLKDMGEVRCWKSGRQRLWIRLK